jgi:hypothetical protein
MKPGLGITGIFAECFNQAAMCRSYDPDSYQEKEKDNCCGYDDYFNNNIHKTPSFLTILD